MHIRHLALKLKGSEYPMTVNIIIIIFQCVFIALFFKCHEAHNCTSHVEEELLCMQVFPDSSFP